MGHHVGCHEHIKDMKQAFVMKTLPQMIYEISFVNDSYVISVIYSEHYSQILGVEP